MSRADLEALGLPVPFPQRPKRVEVYLSCWQVERLTGQGNLGDLVRHIHLSLGHLALENGWRAGPLRIVRGDNLIIFRREGTT